jgi:hypothetical protein
MIYFHFCYKIHEILKVEAPYMTCFLKKYIIHRIERVNVVLNIILIVLGTCFPEQHDSTES